MASGWAAQDRRRMIGVGLDELAPREAQRRHRRLYASQPHRRRHAVHQRPRLHRYRCARRSTRPAARAEGFIGFMLGDLRTKLEPVGRLDVARCRRGKSAGYYEGQNKQSPDRRCAGTASKALTLLGENRAPAWRLDGAYAVMLQPGQALRNWCDAGPMTHSASSTCSECFLGGLGARDRGTWTRRGRCARV